MKYDLYFIFSLYLIGLYGVQLALEGICEVTLYTVA